MSAERVGKNGLDEEDRGGRLGRGSKFFGVISG